MDSIERLAIFFRTILGIPEDVRPELIDLLRRAKMARVIRDFRQGSLEELNGAAAKWIQKSRTILIVHHLWDKLSGSEDAELRFTVLHELGHAALNHADRNRKMGGARQFGDKVTLDEDEADRFALAVAIPLTFIPAIDIFDKKSLTRQFGLPEDKTELRMVDLQMYKRRATSRAYAEIAVFDLCDAETWLKQNAFSDSAPKGKSVPTEDDDWDF